MLYQICRQCHRIFLNSDTLNCRQCSPVIPPLDSNSFVNRLLEYVKIFDSKWRSVPSHSVEELAHVLSALLPWIDLIRRKGKLPRLRFIIENYLWRYHNHTHYYELFHWFLDQYGNVTHLWTMFDENAIQKWVEVYDFQEWNLFHLVYVCWSPSLFSLILQKLPSLLTNPSYFLFLDYENQKTLMDCLYDYFQDQKITEDQYFTQLIRFNLLYIDFLDSNSPSSRTQLPPCLFSPCQEYNYTLFSFLLLYRPLSFLWNSTELLDQYFYYSLHGKESDRLNVHSYPPLSSFKHMEFFISMDTAQVLSYFEWYPHSFQFIIPTSFQLSILSYIAQRRHSEVLHFEMASFLLSQGQEEWALRHFFRAGDYRLLCRYFSIHDKTLSKDHLPCWNNTEDFVLFLLRALS